MGDPHQTLAQLALHGYLVLFGWVAAESVGASTMPILLVAGVLTATGRVSLAAGLGLAACSCGPLGHSIEALSRITHLIASASVALAVSATAGAAAAAAVAFRYARRRYLRRRMQATRITPRELHDLIQRGQHPLIVDLRHPLDMLSDPRMIQGAIRVSSEELSAHHVDLPFDREIVLYCTCPSEATSAQMALRLQALGITRVRPLLGGLDAWKGLGYPLEDATDRIGWR